MHTQILPVPAVDYCFLRIIAARTPVVCTVHELVPHSAKYRRLAGACFAAIYRRADFVFAFTEYTRQRLIQLGVEAEKIMKIPHGNLEHLLSHVSAREARTPQKLPIVLSIGGIRHDKGIDTLVEATRYLRDLVPGVRVQIAGTPGFDLSVLHARIKELGIDDIVEFRLGYLSDREFSEHMQNAEVIALPYRRIEQSGVAIAACTFGKAIVGTRCGGLEELVSEAGNGLLVPVDDPAALAQALSMILLSPEKREAFEVRSRAYARNVLGWGSIVSKTLAGYRVALGRPTTRKREVATTQEI